MSLLPALAPGDLRLAVVGDVHNHWGPADRTALHRLAVDLVLLVGDFGNEVIDLVQQVADLDLPKAVILGNHDAWYTATNWGRKKCPYDRSQEDRVQEQLTALGPAHVGYGKLDLADLGLTVVGGRPFSWGGPNWQFGLFYQRYFDVADMTASTERLCQMVDRAAHDRLIFIGHCGPTGLGDRPEAPCGRDWKPLGGDYGDPDLAAAIAHAHAQGKQVPLVAFGHMHHGLRHRTDRPRQRTARSDNTVYLNAACVPRWVTGVGGQRRNFSIVTLGPAGVKAAHLVWTDAQHQVVSAEALYQADGNGGKDRADAGVALTDLA